MNFDTLQGRIILEIKGAEYNSDEIVFITDDQRRFKLHHYQDCCESVTVEDISGDIQDLINTPILLAEEAISSEPPSGATAIDSDTWTFYKLRTIKGSVDIRWHGISNSNYSESVSFDEMKS